MKRLIYSLCALALAAGGPAAAQSKTGTAIAQFLGIEPSARLSAMGNTGVAVFDGIEAVYYNPAALGSIARPTLQLTHSEWFAGIDYEYAALAYPLREIGTLFGSVTALNSGEIDVRTVDQPLGTGERYTVGDLALGLGFGRRITHRFAVGGQINYVHERIWHTTSNLMTFNLGTVYTFPLSGLKIASSLSNVGTQGRFTGRELAIQFDLNPDVHGDNSALPGEQLTDDFPVPLLFRVGASLPVELSEASRLLVALDAFHPSDNTESISFGGEWTYREALSLRAGYQDLFEEDAELGPTLGVGFQSDLGQNRFHFNYAWAHHDHLSETHRLTFVLGF
ncbi:MAG: PorV/PorQ family protein [Candidatus Eisenbacteria bacterium]|nr:PorV/PorQ family protein [Candidatus Eisenbacteria bacterium]